MICKKRKGAEKRRDAVRRQFREQAERLSQNPAVRLLDSHGRPRRGSRRIINPLPMTAN